MQYSKIALFILVAVVTGILFQYKSFVPVKTVAYKDIVFDSSSKDKYLSSIKEFSENEESDVKDISVSFKFKADAIANYNNIFQTSQGNRGLRIELGPPFLFGFMLSDGTGHGVVGYLITDHLTLKEEHEVRIIVDKEKNVKAWFNGELLVDKKSQPVSFLINDIAIGTGFSKIRPFCGQIKDFSLTYTIYKERIYLIVLKCIMAFVLLAAVFAFLLKPIKYFIDLSVTHSPHNLFPIKEDAANLMMLISLIGFFAAVLFSYWRGVYCGMQYPYNTFMFRPIDRFMDFYNIYNSMLCMDPYYYLDGRFGNYFPFAYLLMAFFTWLPPGMALTIYYLMIIMATWFLFQKICRAKIGLVRILIALLVLNFMTYPFLTLIDRGNLEGGVFIFVGLFIYCFLNKHYVRSAIFLSMAIAMKAYPFILLVFFFKDRRYKELVLAIVATAVLTLVSFTVLHGGLSHNYHGLKNGLSAFNSTYILSSECMHFSASLWGVLQIMKQIFLINNWLVTLLIKHYFILTVTLFTVLSVYIYFIETELWKSFCLLVFAFILFPYVSYDYKLIHVLLVVMLFLVANKWTKIDVFYAVCLGLLLIPKGYWQLLGEISIQSVLNPLIMVVMTMFVICEGITEKLKKRSGKCLS